MCPPASSTCPDLDSAVFLATAATLVMAGAARDRKDAKASWYRLRGRWRNPVEAGASRRGGESAAWVAFMIAHPTPAAVSLNAAQISGICSGLGRVEIVLWAPVATLYGCGSVDSRHDIVGSKPEKMQSSRPSTGD